MSFSLKKLLNFLSIDCNSLSFQTEDRFIAQNWRTLESVDEDFSSFMSNFKPRLQRRIGSANYAFIKVNNTHNGRFVWSGNRMILNFNSNVSDTGVKTTTTSATAATKSSEFKISKPKPWRKDDTESIIANIAAELPADPDEPDLIPKGLLVSGVIKQGAHNLLGSLLEKGKKKLVKITSRRDRTDGF